MVDKLRKLLLLGHLSPEQQIELSMVLDTISSIIMSILSILRCWDSVAPFPWCGHCGNCKLKVLIQKKTKTKQNKQTTEHVYEISTSEFFTERLLSVLPEFRNLNFILSWRKRLGPFGPKNHLPTKTRTTFWDVNVLIWKRWLKTIAKHIRKFEYCFDILWT